MKSELRPRSKYVFESPIQDIKGITPTNRANSVSFSFALTSHYDCNRDSDETVELVGSRGERGVFFIIHIV